MEGEGSEGGESILEDHRAGVCCIVVGGGVGHGGRRRGEGGRG